MGLTWRAHQPGQSQDLCRYLLCLQEPQPELRHDPLGNEACCFAQVLGTVWAPALVSSLVATLIVMMLIHTSMRLPHHPMVSSLTDALLFSLLTQQWVCT
jgi:hypothetical protein